MMILNAPVESSDLEIMHRVVTLLQCTSDLTGLLVRF